MDFSFQVKNDYITIERGKNRCYTGNMNFYRCTFVFDEAWEELSKFAVFQKAGKFFGPIIIADGTCTVPAELLTETGDIHLGLYGTDAQENQTRRISTNWVQIPVFTGAYNTDMTAPDVPTADFWEAYLRQVQEIVDAAIPYIGENGNWYVYDGAKKEYCDTNVPAQGDKGDRGEKGDPGDMPVISIDADTKHWLINGEDSGISAADHTHINQDTLDMIDSAAVRRWENKQPATTVKTYIVQNTPWPNQPPETIDSNVFSTGVSYRITLKNTDGTPLEAGKFKIMETQNAYQSAKEAVFTIPEQVTLAENKPIEFRWIDGVLKICDCPYFYKLNTKNGCRYRVRALLHVNAEMDFRISPLVYLDYRKNIERFMVDTGSAAVTRSVSAYSGNFVANGFPMQRYYRIYLTEEFLVHNDRVVLDFANILLSNYADQNAIERYTSLYGTISMVDGSNFVENQLYICISGTTNRSVILSGSVIMVEESEVTDA